MQHTLSENSACIIAIVLLYENRCGEDSEADIKEES